MSQLSTPDANVCDSCEAAVRALVEVISRDLVMFGVYAPEEDARTRELEDALEAVEIHLAHGLGLQDQGTSAAFRGRE